MSVRHFVLAGLLASASAAQAVTVFSDNFDGDTQLLNQTSFLGGWSVAGGTVDLIGIGGPFDFFPGNGNYVDLDGSTGNAGIFSKALTLTGGVTYSASFQLGGSTRGDTNLVDVVFGSTLASYTLLSSDPLATQTLAFTPSSDGLYTLSFENGGGDNLGAILDNVTVGSTAAIPEPSTYALLLAGLAGIGFTARRRTRR